MIRRGYIIAGLLLVLCGTHATHASQDDTLLLRAVHAKEVAMDSGDASDWQTAYTLLLVAHRAEPSADTLYELGYVAHQLGQTDVAAEHWRDSLAFGLEGPARAKVVAFLAAAVPTLGQIRVAGPIGASVAIRGFQRGTLPLAQTLFVNPGLNELDVTVPQSDRTRRYRVAVVAGGTVALIIESRIGPVSSPPESVTPTQLNLSTEAHPLSQDAHARTLQSRNLDTSTTRRLWLGVTGAGLGLSLASGAALVMSYVKLDSKRTQLALICETPSGSRDGCLHVQPGAYEEGTQLARNIATWKTIRVTGWVGIGLGAVTTAFGLWTISKNRRHIENKKPLQLSANIDSNSATILLACGL